MEKRAILAIGLSILVFIAFQYVQQKRQGQHPLPFAGGQYHGFHVEGARLVALRRRDQSMG